MARLRLMVLVTAFATATLPIPIADAAGPGASVGDANASKAMANDPDNAIRSLDRASNQNYSGNDTVKVPRLGPTSSRGAGSSRTGGVPMGTTR